MSAAKLIALTAEPAMVAHFAAQMLFTPGEPEPDAVLYELEQGCRRALQLVKVEAGE